MVTREYPGSATEERILTDLADKTGRRFVHIGSIDTAERQLAASALPVLRDWVDLVDESNIRGAIYMRFCTPHAGPFVNDILGWLRRDEPDLNLNFLTQALIRCLTLADAERVWASLDTLPRTGFHQALLAKLAAFPITSERAVGGLLSELEDGNYSTEMLGYIAKIKDPRIEAWFKSKVDDAHPVTRLVARRVVNRGKALPKGLEQVARPADQDIVFGAEMDTVAFPAWLREISKQHQLFPPASIVSGEFLTRLATDKWYRIFLPGNRSQPFHLFLRLEDIDVVEVVLSVSVRPTQVSHGQRPSELG